MRLQKIVCTAILFLTLVQNASAGITTSLSFGFGRYRNENGPKDITQPVGLAWALGVGYRYDFASLEGFYYGFKGCGENEYNSGQYDVCAKDRSYGILSRFYFLDIFNIIFGYGEHKVTHWVNPHSTQMSQYYATQQDNKHSGIAYGAGAKKNLTGNLDGFFDIILFQVGNGGDKVSSEVDLFMAGIRYEF